MTTTLTILCVISAMFAAGADNKPSEKKNSLTEAELRTIATSVPDTKTASMLHSVAMATSNVDIRQEYLKTAAACLIASDKKDVYAKHIKSKLLDAEEFEHGLKDECKQCSGDGTKGRRCPVCNGNGTCTSCKGAGRTASYGFDRPKEWKPCRKCNGSGQCGKCNGEGVLKEKCMACAGTGKALSKIVAARVYRDLCNLIADGMAAETRSKPDSEAKRGQRKCLADGVDTSEATPEAIADSSGRNVGACEAETRVKDYWNEASQNNATAEKIGGRTWSYDLEHGDAIIKGVTPKTGDIKIPPAIGDGNYPVTSIRQGAFSRCDGLTSVTIPDSVTYIGERAFEGCGGLVSVTIPDSVTDIMASAFSGCSSLKRVTIGKGIKSIGYDMFSGCTSLTCVTIPQNVESVSVGAFRDCVNLKDVRVLNPGTIIEPGSFRGCSALADRDGFTIVNGALLGYSGKSDHVTIPNSVTSIGGWAFRACKNLKSVTIPDCVTCIGRNAFQGCRGLTSVTIPGSVTSIGEDAFSGCNNLTNIKLGKGVMNIGEDAFANCKKLASMTIPYSVTSVGKGTFSSCESLTSVTIPDSVTSIGEMAFYCCYSLKSVTIPDSVTSIGEMAFCHCRALREVTIPDSVMSIGRYAFQGCDSLVKASIPESFEDSVAGIFEDCKAFSFERGLTIRQMAGTKSYAERVKAYRLEAASGIADAQYELALCLYKGKGVDKNVAEAAKWLRKAADQGHAQAQFGLGSLYLSGEGVDRNVREAANLWRKAAAQGHADALCNLGLLYMDGNRAMNIQRDRIEGLRLLRMALENGSVKAREVLWEISQGY